VITGDGAPEAGAFHAIFVNAGATELLPAWLEALAVDGRILVPLTVDLPVGDVGAGHLLRVVRRHGGYSARFVAPLGIFHCAGARTREGSERLRRAYSDSDVREVASLRRDAHRADEQCWLHGPGFCLSRLAVEDGV
jgi:protein-L-isoaspartate(D-aspartate) O-methyltransferase